MSTPEEEETAEQFEPRLADKIRDLALGEVTGWVKVQADALNLYADRVARLERAVYDIPEELIEKE